MIRVFRPTDRDYTSNGDAVIVPIKARVKNNVNGEFTLELTAESRFYDYLTQGNIIIAPTPQGEQAFRINNQVQRKGDRITVKARHVFYDSENLVIADSYAVDLTCEQALNHFNAATDSVSPFTMHSDITDLNTFRCVRKSLAEAIGTVIERWGGYLVRNNWDISVNKSIGRDLGVTIRYAKNLNELTASYDFSGVATKILPVGKDGILLPELYVYSTVQYSTPYTKAVTINQDINEDDYTTEEEYQAAVITDLRAQAQTLVNKTCYPVITYSLKGKPEKVQDIGDVIQVIDERIGVNITTQVIGYEWDIITESYANLTFGNFGNTLSGLMAKVNSNTKGIVQESVGEVKTEVKNSIDKIYDLLQGSYVVYRGYDILLLDTIPIGAATHVIKFSKDGILISNSGVDGTFTKVYDITTQWLSVPSISLNGVDLGTTLNKKLEAVDILAGSNISIRRDGNKVTISAAGSKGGNTVYAGTSTPSANIGAEDDLYLQLGAKTEDILALENFTTNDYGSHVLTITDWVKTDRTHYSFKINGNPDSQGHGEWAKFLLDGLVDGNTYHLEFDGQFNSGASFPWGYVDCVCINNYSGRFIEFQKNSNLNHYSGNFTYHDGDYLIFNYPAINDNVNFTFTITNLAITGSFIGGIDEIYGKVDSKWQKYEGGESYTAGDNIDITNNVISGAYQAFTGTDGTADGAQGLVPAPTTADVDKVLKSDGTWGDAAAVEANPSGTATDELKKIDIDGTIYNISKSYLIRNAFIYSTDELQVGVWADGKPIYQKTWALSTPLRVVKDWTNTAIDSTDIDRIIECLTFHRDGTCYEEISADPTRSNHTLVGLVAPSNGSNVSYITLQYTKISDTAGSGGYQAYGFTPVIYSTEEREVGVWIDNKPLYEKTWELNNIIVSSSWTSLGIPKGDIERIIDYKIGGVDTQNWTGSASIQANQDNNYVYAQNARAQGGIITVTKVTLWYTKTTDTAGSGSYNTLGVPMVHFDTSEQVIGTWMGETLYQKCVATGGSVPSGATLIERTAMASTGYDTIKYIKS